MKTQAKHTQEWEMQSKARVTREIYGKVHNLMLNTKNRTERLKIAAWLRDYAKSMDERGLSYVSY